MNSLTTINKHGFVNSSSPTFTIVQISMIMYLVYIRNFICTSAYKGKSVNMIIVYISKITSPSGEDVCVIVTYSYSIHNKLLHYSAVIMTVCSGADQRKYQSSASLVFVWGIHRWPVNSRHKGLVTLRIFPFDGVIMVSNDHICRGDALINEHIYFGQCNMNTLCMC